MTVGSNVGASVGGDVGAAVGDAVGVAVGDAVGATVGDAVGATVGDDIVATVGSVVGVSVGDDSDGVNSDGPLGQAPLGTQAGCRTKASGPGNNNTSDCGGRLPLGAVVAPLASKAGKAVAWPKSSSRSVPKFPKSGSVDLGVTVATFDGSGFTGAQRSLLPCTLTMASTSMVMTAEGL